MLVTCKKCKAKIDRDGAYKVIVKNKNNYYCSQSEYDNMVLENESRLKAIDLSFELIGNTTNTALLKELSEIAKVHSYQKIKRYLESEFDYINKSMRKNFVNEYAKIRYFVAIIKNQIGDFMINEKTAETLSYIDIVEDVKYSPTKRKSFNELIDEY